MLYIFIAVIMMALVICFILWRNSKKQSQAYLKEIENLNSRLEALLASYDEMEKELDDAEEAMRRIDKGIGEVKQLRDILLTSHPPKTTLNN